MFAQISDINPLTFDVFCYQPYGSDINHGLLRSTTAFWSQKWTFGIRLLEWPTPRSIAAAPVQKRAITAKSTATTPYVGRQIIPRDQRNRSKGSWWRAFRPRTQRR